MFLTIPHHRNLVRIRDVIKENHGSGILVLEDAGIEVFCLLQRKGKFSEKWAVIIARQIAEGLLHLHRFGICHLDVSLENTLVDQQKVVRLCDLGAAAYCTKLPSQLRGRELYAAPEILIGQSYDGKAADMFSLGICIFLMLFGFFPYKNPNPEDNGFLAVTYGDVQELMDTHNIQGQISKYAFSVLEKLLCPQSVRWTINELLDHPWFSI
jgi:serine/threonine protein kinase